MNKLLIKKEIDSMKLYVTIKDLDLVSLLFLSIQSWIPSRAQYAQTRLLFAKNKSFCSIQLYSDHFYLRKYGLRLSFEY